MNVQPASTNSLFVCFSFPLCVLCIFELQTLTQSPWAWVTIFFFSIKYVFQRRDSIRSFYIYLFFNPANCGLSFLDISPVGNSCLSVTSMQLSYTREKKWEFNGPQIGRDLSSDSNFFPLTVFRISSLSQKCLIYTVLLQVIYISPIFTFFLYFVWVSTNWALKNKKHIQKCCQPGRYMTE